MDSIVPAGPRSAGNRGVVAQEISDGVGWTELVSNPYDQPAAISRRVDCGVGGHDQRLYLPARDRHPSIDFQEIALQVEQQKGGPTVANLLGGHEGVLSRVGAVIVRTHT
jgi:hypothetical protein